MTTSHTRHPSPALPLVPSVGLLCIGLAALIAFLAAAPDPMVRGGLTRALDLFGVEAPGVRDWVLNSAKLGHAVFFGLLAFGLMLAIPTRPHTAALTAFALGAFLEFTQLFMDTRTARLGDLIYNAAGIGAAFLVFSVVTIRREETRNPKSETRMEAEYAYLDDEEDLEWDRWVHFTMGTQQSDFFHHRDTESTEGFQGIGVPPIP
jgi:VanZ family protein